MTNPSSHPEPAKGVFTFLPGFGLLTAVVYGLLVLTMWLPYGPHSGMPYETTFAQWSENESIWAGFFFQGDPLRPYTNTFYHLSYLLGGPLGMPGSFVTYGLVYCLLWWARGFLVYLVLQEFQPKYRLFNFMVGTLVLTHAADGALQWVGQMNQFGVLFWMLLAYWCALLFLRQTSLLRSAVTLILCMFFLHMSLWSYEAQLPIVLVLPLLLFTLRDRTLARRLGIAAAWYLVAAVYIGQSAVRYLSQTNTAYQQGVLKKGGLNFATLLSDWWFNISQGSQFFTWAKGLPDAAVLAPGCPVVWGGNALWLLVAGAIAAMLFGAWRIWRARPAATDDSPGLRRLLVLFGWGLALLALSFPVFLLLDSARGLWRTQIIAGLGYGLTLAALAALVAGVVRNRLARAAVFVLLCAVPLTYGLRAGIKRGAYHYGIWERHRFAVAQILSLIPSIKPGSTIMLTNVPKEASPFGDNMWYLVALQLAYPRTYLAGAYFHADHSPAPSFNLRVDGKDWIWNGIGWPPAEPRRFPFDQTIIVEFSPAGRPKLLEQVPDYFPVSPELTPAYRPLQSIRPKPLIDYGARRYLRSGMIR